MSLRKELALTFPLLCLLVLLPFWRIATGQGVVITNDIGISDIANLQHPLRHFASQELRQGRLPLWTPGIYMGYPLLAEGQAGIFYPFNLFLFGLLSVPGALSISILLPFVIAATGAYLLARELGAGITGALLAGLSYALSGFFVVHVKHMPMVEAACWIPLVFWLVERGARRSDGALLSVGLVMGAQWLAGAPQMAYYTAGVSTLYFAGRAWQLQRGRSPRRTVPLFGLALVLSLGLGAIQLLPTYELVGFSERSGGVGYEFAASFPYALENLKTFLYPLANGDPGLGNQAVSSIFWEDYAYLGLAPLLVGVVGGLALVRHSGVARLLVTLTVVTFTLALGSNTPLFRLAYYGVPGMGLFRFPQRFFAFAMLFLVVLAAMALTRFIERPLRRTRNKRRKTKDKEWRLTRILRGVVVILTFIDLYFYHALWNAIVDADSWLEPPETAEAIQERAGSALYRIFSFDAYNTHRAAYRQVGGWRGDLQPYIAQRDFLQPSLNLIYDIPAAEGYVNLVPDCLVALWGNEKQKGLMDAALVEADDHFSVRPGFIKLLSLYNVRFLIAAQPVQDEALELVGVYDSGAHLYENRATLPRAFAVPSYTFASDVPATLSAMLPATFDPATTVVLLESPDTPPLTPPHETGRKQSTSPPSAGETGGGHLAAVDVITYEPTHVVVEADLSSPGWLVLSDTYYPGWEATVDGRPTPIYRANGCVRAVPLEGGKHEVVFRFRPRAFYWGALISGASAVLWVTIWLLLKYKKVPGTLTEPGT
jgi:hypothetical protein